MRNVKVLLLLIIPTIAFPQPNDYIRILGQPLKDQVSSDYTKISRQIEEMEPNFISTLPLKKADAVITLLDSTRTYQFNTSKDSLLIDRTLLNYNSTGTLKLKSNYFWDDYFKMMLNNKYEYLYNKSNNLITLTFNEWMVYHSDAYTSPDGVFHQEGVDSINNLTKYRYTYDKSGRQSTISYNVYDRNYKYYYNWKYTQFYYDVAGNRKSMVCSVSDDYPSPFKEEYTYDVNKNLLTITQYRQARDYDWFYSGKTKYDYTYDSDARVTSLLSAYWSFKSGQWKTVSKVDYAYHANGGLESRVYAIIDTVSNKLVPANRTAFTYNKIDKINLREDYAWNKSDSQWELRKKQYYYYNNSGFTANLDESSLDSEMPFSIFPNPAKEFLYIENSIDYGSSMYLYNSDGQCVKTKRLEKGMNTISLMQLPKGIYFITIPDKNDLKSCKLIVE